jgi:Na+:H+ antiporter, NhaC family
MQIVLLAAGARGRVRGHRDWDGDRGAIVGVVTESSWTTAGTLGVAFVGMAPVLKISEAIAAGAVISGGYMGDKMSPLSETTVLVPQLVGGVTTNQPIRGMLTTVVPSFGLAFAIFLGIGSPKAPPDR